MLPGFLANRLQHALAREAYALIDAGVATAADVDAASRMLVRGLANALATAAADPQSVFGAANRPWALLWMAARRA